MQVTNDQKNLYADLKALLDRAHCGMLISALADRPASFAEWRAYAKALTDLQTGKGLALAAKDSKSGGYEPASCLQAAWTRLPVGIELLTLADVQQFLTTQGVQISAETVPALQLDAAQQFNGNAVAVINANHEHAPAVIDVNDGASGHKKSLEAFGIDVQSAGIVTSQSGAA